MSVQKLGILVVKLIAAKSLLTCCWGTVGNVDGVAMTLEGKRGTRVLKKAKSMWRDVTQCETRGQ